MKQESSCLPLFNSDIGGLGGHSSRGRVGGSLDIFMSFLPLRVLGAVGSPLGGGSGSTPLLTSGTSTVPAGSTGGTSAREAGGGSVPVTGSGLEGGLDGRSLLLDGLLVLDLLLILSFRVAVCVVLASAPFFVS